MVHTSGLFVFSALAIFWTWPLAVHLGTRVPHDPGDSILNIWILWWNAQAIPFTHAWWNPPVFYPMPGALALSEHLAGLSLFATPIQLAGGSPLAAYNVSMLLSYALSGFFAYLLAFRLTGSILAGLCAGLAFGFSPYRASQLAHIQVLTAQWMPLALLGLHEHVASGSRRGLAVFAIAWLLQALSNGYYLLFFPILVVLWLAWFVDWHLVPKRGLAIVAVWIAASLPLVPVLLKYREVHGILGLTRTVEEIRQFSAMPASFLHAPPILRVWPEGPAPTYEQYLFPGLTAAALVIAGLLMLLLRRGPHAAPSARAPLVFYAMATIVMWILALGPGGEGTSASLVRPYTWLLWLPGFDGLRVTSRFAMPGSLCLAIAASLALVQFAPKPGRRRAVAGAIVLAGIGLDGLTDAVPMHAPPRRVELPGPSNATVIELPPNDANVNVAAMYRSMFHGRPLVNAYTGHEPPHYNVLSLSLWRGDPSVLTFLARERPLVILVNDHLDPNRGFRDMIAALPAVEWHGISSAGSLFLLPAQPLVEHAPVGRALAARVRDVGRDRLEFDLGTSSTIRAIEFPLRSRYEDLAKELLIEASEDGVTWREAWIGWTGGLAIEGTLTDPRLAPIRIPLTGISARYLRVYPASSWMTNELTVVGSGGS
jgi:hypothetical protein